MIDKFGLHELQPVVDLVQIAIKRHLSGGNEFIHIKDGRLAFGEVKESSYTTNSEFVFGDFITTIQRSYWGGMALSIIML